MTTREQRIMMKWAKDTGVILTPIKINLLKFGDKVYKDVDELAVAIHRALKEVA